MKLIPQSYEDEDTTESLLYDAQSRYNQLQERFVSLKTIAETLKEQILNERKLWKDELKETLVLENQLRNKIKYDSGDSGVSSEEYKKKLAMFKDFLIFSEAKNKLEIETQKFKYEQSLFDVESKCNLELLKIEQSMIILKPLRVIASTWKKDYFDEDKNVRCVRGGDGGEKSLCENEIIDVDTTNSELTIDE